MTDKERTPRSFPKPDDKEVAPTETEGAALIPNDEELTSPTSNDVGEQTKTQADTEANGDTEEA